MELKVATIYTIDRENNTTTKNIPEDDIKFNEYLHKVLITMANNKIVKNYKSKAKTTQVINCIKDIIENQSEPTVCEEFFDSVSMRLLEKEISAQSKIEKMEKSVQVGSLIQALFYDKDNQRYMFLLAKVAHVVFVNQVGYQIHKVFQKILRFINRQYFLLTKLVTKNLEFNYTKIQLLSIGIMNFLN